MSEHVHIDKQGNEHKLSEMPVEHIMNIMRFIEEKARQGLLIRQGGRSICDDDRWYEEDMIYGDDVKERLNYYSFENEIKRRGRK